MVTARRIAALVLAAGALVGCNNTSVDREELEGVECVVVRNKFSDRIRALDCNWEREQ